MGMLTREEILQKQDLKTRKVDIPEWDGHVFIRPMTSTERDNWESKVLSENGKTPPQLRATLASQLVCDETGKQLFSEEDIEALGKKSAAAINKIFEEVLGLNKITDEDINELAKN